MLRGFFGNLIFAIIARMLCGNHLKFPDWPSSLLVLCVGAQVNIKSFFALYLSSPRSLDDDKLFYPLSTFHTPPLHLLEMSYVLLKYLQTAVSGVTNWR